MSNSAIDLDHARQIASGVLEGAYSDWRSDIPFILWCLGAPPGIYPNPNQP